MNEQLSFDFINKSFDDMKFDYLHRRITELNAQVERLHKLLADSVSCCCSGCSRCNKALVENYEKNGEFQE